MKSKIFGRDDLLMVAENIANEVGNIDIAEELAERMANTAYEFLKYLEKGGVYHYTNY